MLERRERDGSCSGVEMGLTGFSNPDPRGLLSLHLSNNPLSSPEEEIRLLRMIYSATRDIQTSLGRLPGKFVWPRDVLRMYAITICLLVLLGVECVNVNVNVKVNVSMNMNHPQSYPSRSLLSACSMNTLFDETILY
jgi:hypothetical protein